jgi:phage shock protein C
MAYDRHPTPQERSNKPQYIGEEPQYLSAQPASRTRFYLDKRNGKLFGICAGVADYTGFDVAIVRVAFLAAMFMSGGGILPFYFIAAMVTPTKPVSLERVDSEEKQFWQGVRASPTRAARDIRSRLKDIDRRLADIESYVTTENRSLAREIDALALDNGGKA